VGVLVEVGDDVAVKALIIAVWSVTHCCALVLCALDVAFVTSSWQLAF
jgi:hypothetical protein